ncbi:MAG TPA: acetyltransferase, partial [Clostridium sp.]|nr:acetyltransferase [Clostridium sp.]
LKLKWWYWTEEKIFKNLEVLCSSDLDKIKSIK